MKKVMVLVATLASVSMLQARPAAAEIPTQTKQEATALGAIALGAATGGPVGLLAGLAVGVWLVDEVGRAGAHDDIALELTAAREHLSGANAQVAVLEQQLAGAKQEQRRLARAMLDSLEVAMMFRTGESALSDAGRDQLKSLARYLRQNPDVQVRVHGYADARGDAGANLALSRARAESVVEALAKNGVPSGRMRIDAYGEQQASANPGDIDAQALDRKVIIELSRTRGVAAQLQP